MSTRFAAAILAGGLGVRLGGVAKSDVRIGGKRLIERVAAAIEADCDPILAAIGHHGRAELALPPGVLAVADITEGQQGPIAGLAAAVDWFAEREAPDFLLSVAVDTPFFPARFAARALAALDAGADVAVAAYAGQHYPTNAVWRFSALAGLPRRLRSGDAPHSLKRLIAERRAIVLDWPLDPAGDPFANVNTPDDLAALQARAASS